jgi:hypothetical protein
MVMDVMPWQVVVFISIPEAFLIMLMGLALTGLRPDLKRLAIAAVIQAVGSFFIRQLNFPYGVHILIQLVTMVVIAKYCLRYRWPVVMPGILLGSGNIHRHTGPVVFAPVIKYSAFGSYSKQYLDTGSGSDAGAGCNAYLYTYLLQIQLKSL